MMQRWLLWKYIQNITQTLILIDTCKGLIHIHAACVYWLQSVSWGCITKPVHNGVKLLSDFTPYFVYFFHERNKLLIYLFFTESSVFSSFLSPAVVIFPFDQVHVVTPMKDSASSCSDTTLSAPLVMVAELREKKKKKEKRESRGEW